MDKKGHSRESDPFCDLSQHSRGGTRTPDPVINSHLLYHLSYSGTASYFTPSALHGQANGALISCPRLAQR